MSQHSDIIFEVCDLKAEDSNPLTNLEELLRYLKLRCGVVRGLGEGMKNIQSIADGWLVKLETDGIVNFSHAKLEREIMTVRNWDRLLSEHALLDTKIFSRIKKAVKRYKDDEKDMVILRSYEKEYKETRRTFDQEVAKLEFVKEKYHKKAFEAEKAEIKRELASREDDKKKYGDMFEELTKKTEEKIQEYLEQTSKLEACAQNLIEASSKYEAAKFRVDQKRAIFCIEKLQEYTHNMTLRPTGAEEGDLSGIRIDEIIRNQQPMEQITIRKVEIYQGTKNKDTLFQQVRDEIQTDKGNSNGQDGNNTGPTRCKSQSSTSSPTSGIEIGKKYLITTTFKKLRPNQISLIQGKTVKLLMPPNDNGYAFGEIKGKFGSKEKGYFPINNVITKL